jgi:hypothetical protein
VENEGRCHGICASVARNDAFAKFPLLEESEMCEWYRFWKGESSFLNTRFHHFHPFFSFILTRYMNELESMGQAIAPTMDATACHARP